MRCVDRKGNEIGENAAQGRVLKALMRLLPEEFYLDF